MNHRKFLFRTLVWILPLWTCLLAVPGPLQATPASGSMNRGAPPTIICPTDILQANDPGVCTAVVVYTPPPNTIQIAGLPSGSAFPLGPMVNTFVDTVAEDTCSFTVTIYDGEPPVITCPGDIFRSYDAGLCTGITYEMPVATDNCSTPTVQQIAGFASGSVFPAGTTVNTFKATDAAGNTSLCSFTVTIGTGMTTVLATDGSFSGDNAPQGSLRYQRELYLVTPKEVQASGLKNGMTVGSIGFTIGASSPDTARGHLKVWLQNTTDTESRTDTAWTTATATTNAYHANLPAGSWEWEVRANCTGSQGYSDPVLFANDDLSGCNTPYNLSADPVTVNTAKLHWECVSSGVFTGFKVEYRIGNSGNWTQVSTNDTFCLVTGLHADTGYQWQVRTVCSGDDSQSASSSFQTAVVDNCNEPTGLSLGTLGDTTVSLSWTGASGATMYELRYRRYGTTTWYTTFASSIPFTLTGLDPGTKYEWNLRTVCSGGKGSYVNGSPFTTTGATACYVPSEPVTSQITSSGAWLKWLPVNGATSYTIRYRLHEAISWANATGPMTPVSDSLVTIPDTIGYYEIPFHHGTPFTYQGNGLYVAWEFSRPGGALTQENRSLCTRANTSIKGSNGIDSLKVILCLSGKTTATSTGLPPILTSSSQRPETRLGSPALKDSVAVSRVYTLGSAAIPYADPPLLRALVQNFTTHSKSCAVTVLVKDQATGTQRFTQTVNVNVPAGCKSLASFTGWSPTIAETDSVIVTVPGLAGENVLGNNRCAVVQKVNPYVSGYLDETSAISGAGYGNNGGLILSRYRMNGCGKVIGTQVFLHQSAEGHPLHAVMLSAAGSVLDSSSVFTPDSSAVNNTYTFFFPHTPLVTNNDYFVGIAQQPDAVNASYPVGLQYEGTLVRDSAYYGATLGGSGLDDHRFPGRLMISAEMIPGMPVAEISGSEVLCAGDTNTLQAAATTTRFADRVVSFSSEFDNARYRTRQLLGTPDVWPGSNADPGVWLSDSPDGQRESLILGFPTPAPVDFVDIYEITSPGAVDTVYVKNASGTFVKVWSDSARLATPTPRVNHITFPRTAYNVSEIRLAINSPKVAGYNAIDAVGIGVYDDPATFSSYQWGPGGQTTQGIQAATAGTYTLQVTNAGGCQSSASKTLTTPTQVAPVITANGPLTFCTGDSVVLTSSYDHNNTWSSGETTQSIVARTSGTYTVSYNNGCTTLTSLAASVTVNPLPVVSVTGGSICPGTSGTLDAGAGYTAYSWSTGATTRTISVTAPGIYTVNVTDANGCQGTGTGYAFIAPVPNPVISGDPFFCPGSSTVLDAGGGYASYTWSTGAQTQTISAGTVGTFSVTVTNEYGCPGSASVTTGTYPLPTPVITGTLSLCAGTTTVLDAGLGYLAYLWNTGEITHSIVVDTAATFTVQVTDIHGCTGSSSATTTTDGAMPDTPGPITGPTTGVCNNAGLVWMIAPVPNTTHYVWTVPPGMNIVSGQGTTSITASVGTLTSGVISVAASNACGQSPSWTPCTLTVYGTPSDPGSITGQSSAVCGMTNVPYSVAVVPGATSYTWTAPAGATVTGGQGTSLVTVSYTSAFSSGNLCVVTSSPCGTSNPSCLLVKGLPLMPGPIIGPAEVCKKQKNVGYSVTPVQGATTYTWTVPPQSVITGGQGTPSITVNFETQSGQVTVTAGNSCGTSAPQILPVTVKTCTKMDLISGDTTGTGNSGGTNGSYGSEYASLRPEVIATAGDYSVGTQGTLSWTLGEPVIETFALGSTIVTQGFQQAAWQVVAVNDRTEDASYDVEVYPVPASDYVTVRIHAITVPIHLRVELYAADGEIVTTRTVTTSTYEDRIDLSQYPSGNFLLKVVNVDNGKVRTFKVIKVKW